MSGPLIFVLQLVGACMLFFGISIGITSGDFAMAIVGGIMIIIGGIGYRSKTRNNKREKSRDNSNNSEIVNVLREQNELLKRQLEKK